MSIVGPGEHLHSIATRRSMLPPPGTTDTPEARRSFDWLFRRYAPAMVRYVRSILARAGGPPRESDAEDVVQGYLVECLEKGWLSTDAGSIRCFRAWLQTQLRRYTLTRLRDARAAKRAPGAMAPADPNRHGSSDDDPAERDLDRGFIDVATSLALDDLREGNSLYHEIIADLLRTDGAGSADLAARLDRSDAQLVHLRHRARRRFAILLFDRLRETVRDDEDHVALCRRLEPYLP